MDRLGETFLVADIIRGGGWLAGFCSYGGSQIYGLYIHPQWTGRGLASALLDRAEAALIAGRIERILIRASRIDRPLYEKRGYAVLGRRDWKTRGGLVMEAFDMEKRVAGGPPGR
jgi:putative acetyltransferase